MNRQLKPPVAARLLRGFAFAAAAVALVVMRGDATAAGPAVASPAPSQRVTFSYEARTRASHLDPNGLLIEGAAGAPAPAKAAKGTGDQQAPPSVLVGVATTIDIDAAYELMPADSYVAGAIEAAVHITAGEGWERLWPLEAGVPFAGPRGVRRVSLDVQAMAARLAAIEKETNYRPSFYQVVVEFEVRMTGTTAAGAPLDLNFKAPFTMQWSGTRIALETNLVRESQPPAPPRRSMPLSFMGVPLPQSLLERGLALAGVIASILAAGLGWSLLQQSPKLTQVRFGGKSVKASFAAGTANDRARRVQIASLPELARVAETASLPLCHDEMRRVFFAIDRDIVYFWEERRVRRASQKPPKSKPATLQPEPAAVGGDDGQAAA